MARPAGSYRAARRARARAEHTVWGTGRQTITLGDGFRYGSHASLDARLIVPQLSKANRLSRAKRTG